MGDRLQLRLHLFQHVGLPVDDRLQQSDQDMRTTVASKIGFLRETIEQPTWCKAYRDQALGRDNEAYRDRARLGLRAADQRHAEIEGAIARGEPAGALDLINF